MKSKTLSHTISSNVTEDFYALMKDDKFLSVEEWTVDQETGKVTIIMTDDPTNAYTFRNKDRAVFHLAEYETRLKGFKVAHVEETIIKMYRIN